MMWVFTEEKMEVSIMKLRIATFNLEEFADVNGNSPSLEERLRVMRPQIKRLNADIICFQEVDGQKSDGEQPQLLALEKLLETTDYSNYYMTSTLTSERRVYIKTNLVTISRFEILETEQYNNDFIPSPIYKKITANPEEDPKPIKWERPVLYAKIQVRPTLVIHLINLHLKSRRPTGIQGQMINEYKWRSGSGWAEAFFISSMKRVGQALETRYLVDNIFEDDEDANIIVCGDLNAHPDEVPVEAICGHTENTGNSELNKRVMFSCEKSIPEPSRYTYLHQGQKRLLDHMLISLGMTQYYRKSEIHNETLHDESIAFATDEKFPESDHAPFVAEFEI